MPLGTKILPSFVDHEPWQKSMTSRDPPIFESRYFEFSTVVGMCVSPLQVGFFPKSREVFSVFFLSGLLLEVSLPLYSQCEISGQITPRFFRFFFAFRGRALDLLV